MKEIWKIFKPNPNYEISNMGKVRNLCTLKELAQIDNGHGYKTVTLYESSHGRRYYVHRLVAFTFLENKENKPEVNHLDGNKANNKVTNLEWCTQIENNRHAVKIGLRVCTEKMRANSKKQINIVNNNPILRAKGIKKSIETNKAKKQSEYIMNSSNQFKPIKCLELNRVFLSARRVEQKLGIKKQTIQKAMTKNYETCQGYHWIRIKKHRFNNYGKFI